MQLVRRDLEPVPMGRDDHRRALLPQRAGVWDHVAGGASLAQHRLPRVDRRQGAPPEQCGRQRSEGGSAQSPTPHRMRKR